MPRILQCNLNRSRQAQDHLLQLMAEYNAGLAAISEPNNVPDNNKWLRAADNFESAAILWRKCKGHFSPMSALERGNFYCSIKWNNLVIVSCYIPPKYDLSIFRAFLNDLQVLVNLYNKFPILLLGDFNSRFSDWDRGITNARGRLLYDWTNDSDLSVLNKDFTPTCVRAQGKSVVDLVIGNRLALNLGLRCTVEINAVTLSNHRLILIEYEESQSRKLFSRINNKFPRWNYNKMDADLLNTASIFQNWSFHYEIQPSILKLEHRINSDLKEVADISMPRNSGSLIESFYWWNTELSDLRKIVQKNRRILSRTKKKRIDYFINEAYKEYKKSLNSFRFHIRKAKSNAWNELLANINEDPWGLSYKIALNKLKPVSHPVCESLSCEVIDKIIDTLFPCDVENNTNEEEIPIIWQDDLQVTRLEVKKALEKVKGNKKASGPDGILGGVLASVSGEFWGIWSFCFTACLREEIFPASWKISKLVLLKKKEGESDNPRIYRPICLLNEIGKLFERIVVHRLHEHLELTGGLSSYQFGFRMGKSTIDAIGAVKQAIQEELRAGRVTIAVSLDIVNAFNTIPWGVIKRAMNSLEFPSYLRRIISAYLTDRWLVFVDREGKINKKPVSRGVPQDSALGPTLWNIGYNSVLCTQLPDFCRIFGYADDTLVLGSGDSFEEAAYAANYATVLITREISRVGLEISAEKTQITCFPLSAIPDRGGMLYIKNRGIAVSRNIKYLGLLLDGDFCFLPHFVYISGKVDKTIRLMNSILPNCRGPNEKRKKLYLSVVLSIILYGAPVWHAEFRRSNEAKTIINRLMRRISQRVCGVFRRGSAALIAQFHMLQLCY